MDNLKRGGILLEEKKLTSNLKKIVDNISSGEFKTLGENDTFEFGCIVCGKCCTDRNDIVLNPIDLHRISKLLNMDTHSVIDKYCEFILGSDTKFPLLRAKFDLGVVYGKMTNVCPFLKRNEHSSKESYICSIHKAKPYSCAIYPLGRVTNYDNKTNEITTSYFLQPVNCEGSRNKVPHRVSKWINEFDLKEHEKLSSGYIEFTRQCFKLFDFSDFIKNAPVGIEAKDMLLGGIASILYDGMTTETKDMSFEDTLKARYEKVLEIIKQFKDKMTEVGFTVKGYGEI